MLAEIKTVYTRSSATILQDTAGAAALLIILATSLHLPTMF